MILISGAPADIVALKEQYAENSTERRVLDILSESGQRHAYGSLGQLKFELELRREIVTASKRLYRSRLDFAVFRESRCNPEFWERTQNGGFRLKNGVKASSGIGDIFANGQKYATECATAMIIVYYKALLDVYSAELFDATFPGIYLMNWHALDRLLRETGAMKKVGDYLPGDRRYVANPDVSPLTPEWQGENLIDLDGRLYYGHGIGIVTIDTVISALNQNRRPDAESSAYLMEEAGRPDFKKLFEVVPRGAGL